jgi:hypothetical protein
MLYAYLETRERKVRSQNGEDGVLEALFEMLGVTNQYCVEFGCEDGLECNTAHLLDQGWTGLLMDGGNVCRNPRANIRQEFITAENINELFRKYEVPQHFDLLSIDIDSNDFWVWREITVRPRVVVIEYNSHVPPDLCRAMVYEPEFVNLGTDYFGASLAALKELGRRKGYTLVYCERAGVNAFFIANEIVPADFRPRAIEAIYRRPNYDYRGWRYPADARQMIDPFLEGNERYFRADVASTGWAVGD